MLYNFFTSSEWLADESARMLGSKPACGPTLQEKKIKHTKTKYTLKIVHF